MGVQLVGLEKTMARIKKTEDKLKSPSDFKNAAALLVLAAAQEAHQEQGPGWQKLDPDTVKRKHGRGRILEFTGKLVKSMGVVFGPDYVGVIYKQFYGRFHQRGEGGMPQRAVRFTADSLKAIVELGRRTFGWSKS